ncbi:MAG: hypothetical protein FIB04_07310, partial [Gammaproteobacteria bacterium]|nr:hypothetical protein [Gammaproteobacteria bacterium]
MKKPNLVLMAALAAAGLVGITGGALVPTVAVAADSSQKLSAKIVAPLRAVQEATSKKEWDAAYESWKQAQAIEPKTPYEQYIVDDMGWYILIQKKDMAGAAEVLERAVNSGQMPPADVTPRLKALAQLNYQVQNYAKAADFGNKYLAQVPGDQDIAVLVAQSYYLQKDYTNTRATVDKLTAGQATPNEQLLLLGLRSNFELKDRVGTMKSLESLVRYYPKQKYWEDLLTNQLYETKGDRELRTLYRLADQTGTLDKPDEYSEMATVLIAGGFPYEAQQILERGMSAGVFTGDVKTREQGDLDKARSGATANRKDLATADKAQGSAKPGN